MSPALLAGLVLTLWGQLAASTCQTVYGGLCSPQTSLPCCNPDWSCLRHVESTCGGGGGATDKLQYRCGIAGGSAPLNNYYAPPINAEVLVVSTEDVPETLAPEITVEPVNDETCALSCVSAYTVRVGATGPTVISASSLAKIAGCGGVSLSRESFSCSDLGTTVNVTVNADANLQSCSVPISVEEVPQMIQCKSNLQVALSEIGDYIFQQTDLVTTVRNCSAHVPNILHSPVMATCGNVPSMSVSVFFGTVSTRCQVAVLGNSQCVQKK